MKILGIHRTDGVDIETEGIGNNTRLWNRIQDIAYGSEHYDEQILKELRDVIQSIRAWRYKNSEDETKQEKWNDMIKTLNEL